MARVFLPPLATSSRRSSAMCPADHSLALRAWVNSARLDYRLLIAATMMPTSKAVPMTKAR